MQKILVVEDNENNLYLITFILEKMGHKVIVAKTGEEGVELRSERTARPDPYGHPASGDQRTRSHAKD